MTLPDSNRVTLLTPPGIGALAVVRVVGPRVAAFLQAHFSKGARPGRCVHGELRVGGQVIDDPVVALSADGSFADVSLHGGDWIVRRTLDLATGFGFQHVMQVATEEALDAVERDMLTALPVARTELAIRALLAQPVAWRALRERDDRDALRRAVADVTLANLLRLPRVAIVGPPNVGKSTLANRLFGSERSITADLPGTTRDWVGEIADIDGLAVMLVDTPGVRQTTDDIEHRAIELVTAQSMIADLVVLVLDATQPASTAITDLATRHSNAIVVLNKADRRSTVPPTIPIHCQTVATTGDGVAALRRAIADRFACADVDPTVPRCWTDGQRAMARTVLADGRS